MNLSTLRTQMCSFLGDPGQTRYPDQYDDALNRAQEQFALETKSLWKDVTWTTVSGTSAYPFSGASTDISATFLWEDFVLYDGYELVPISRHELNRMNPGRDWTADEGTPTHFIIDPEETAKRLVLYPIPQEAKTISLRARVVPTAMSAGSDIPLNSTALLAQYHIGIAAYGAWLLLTGETQTPDIVQKRVEVMDIYKQARDQAIDYFGNTVSQPIKIKGSFIWS